MERRDTPHWLSLGLRAWHFPRRESDRASDHPHTGSQGAHNTPGCCWKPPDYVPAKEGEVKDRPIALQEDVITGSRTLGNWKITFLSLGTSVC